METFDVVVVGGGLAGLYATRLAAERGLTVLLVERKPRVDAAVHTTGIFVRRTLEDFALPPATLGPPVRCVRVLGPSLRGFTLESRHDEFRVGRMAQLYARLAEQAGASGAAIRPATRYLGAETDGPATIVRLETARRETTVRARLLFAADGAVSRVAGDLGLDENRAWIAGVEDVYAGIPLEGPPRFTCVLDPAVAPGYLAWYVHDGQETHVGVGGYARRFDPGAALDAFTRRIARVERMDRGVRLERRGGLIPVGGVLPRIASRRGILLGDAAGAPSPLTAGGLDPCLRLSAAAVDAAARALDGDPGALAAFDGRRFRARFASRLAMRRALAVVRHRPVAEALVAAMAVTPLRVLAAHVFFGRGSFPADAVTGPRRFAEGDVTRA
jgi:flavin-dependent dehydrogenase